MGIEINVSGLNVSGNAEVMDNVKIRNGDEIHIRLQNADIGDSAKVLNNLEIDPLLEELTLRAQNMDEESPEYSAIKKILGVKKWNKADFIGCVMKHIGDFSQGVLASIVAAHLLTK